MSDEIEDTLVGFAQQINDLSQQIEKFSDEMNRKLRDLENDVKNYRPSMSADLLAELHEMRNAIEKKGEDKSPRDIKLIDEPRLPVRFAAVSLITGIVLLLAVVVASAVILQDNSQNLGAVGWGFWAAVAVMAVLGVFLVYKAACLIRDLTTRR